MLRKALGDHIFEAYLTEKWAEWSEYRAQVHQWEIDKLHGVVLTLRLRPPRLAPARREPWPGRSAAGAAGPVFQADRDWDVRPAGVAVTP